MALQCKQYLNILSEWHKYPIFYPENTQNIELSGFPPEIDRSGPAASPEVFLSRENGAFLRIDEPGILM